MLVFVRCDGCQARVSDRQTAWVEDEGLLCNRCQRDKGMYGRGQ